MAREYTLEIVWMVVLILLFLTSPTGAQLSDDLYWEPTIALCPRDGTDCEPVLEPPGL